MAPVSANPTKSALHDPANAEWFESFRIRRPAAYFHTPFAVAMLGQPSVVFVVVIFVIPKDDLKTRKRLHCYFSHDLLGADRVIHVAGGHDDSQKQPQSIHHYVPLAPLDLF